MLVQKLVESLPQSAYSATQVLENEAKMAEIANIPMVQLMENAGRCCFSHITKHYPKCGKLLVLCGKGNNGGDGFVIARLAHEHGIKVTVVMVSSPSVLRGDAKTAFNKLTQTKINIVQYDELSNWRSLINGSGFDLIVDAIFGIGFKGALPESLSQIVNDVNETQMPIISVDVPTGLNASTGTASPNTIIASDTITFIVVKQGLLTGQAANYVGNLLLADLSLGSLFQQNINSTIAVQGANVVSHSLPSLPKRRNCSHKGDIGLLLCIGGNQGFPGAIRLASEAGLRSGAALVSVCCHEDNSAMIVSGRPELMLTQISDNQWQNSRHVQKAKVLLCGPGLGQNSWASHHFSQAMMTKKPMVVDADALHLLAKNPQKRNNWVLTPHPGEAAILLGCPVSEVENNRFNAVMQLTQKYGGVCVLKGAGSLICDGKNIWINTSGNSGMASGGMGDVLSGIIAALLMQLDDHISATRLAVFIHGEAANIMAKKCGKIGMLASDLLPVVQQLLNRE